MYCSLYFSSWLNFSSNYLTYLFESGSLLAKDRLFSLLENRSLEILSLVCMIYSIFWLSIAKELYFCCRTVNSTIFSFLTVFSSFCMESIASHFANSMFLLPNYVLNIYVCCLHFTIYSVKSFTLSFSYSFSLDINMLSSLRLLC